ncbi:hypothetical protein SEA_OCTOBIEN14_73 [Gordonia phage Octobien14]|uniref:Uncharacterized protein n=1 Tax=Gordonia phage Octobien14 TaxID=2483673 RepID=A0A3G3MAE1_9CAUD|nr:hypothetical protein L3Y22_gp073 [Gordonia phage Octobien14]AYR03219.1 hypothetical protein SEA_OCTOBIEN14_73 [Gordonia phage Octobien14]
MSTNGKSHLTTPAFSVYGEEASVLVRPSTKHKGGIMLNQASSWVHLDPGMVDAVQDAIDQLTGN